MNKREEVVKALREHIGVIRSCALMMAHAQSKDARTEYLQRLNKKLAATEDLLSKLSELA